LKSFILTCLIVISLGLFVGCSDINEGEIAPDGSTLTFSLGPTGIQSCGTGIEPELYRVVVRNSEGQPLNGVRVTFDLTFAELNSLPLVIDINGDGIAETPFIQLIDNNACFPEQCLRTPINQWFEQGAFVFSPVDIVSDNNGVAEIIILYSGAFTIFERTGIFLRFDPAIIRAFSGTASAQEIELEINTECCEDNRFNSLCCEIPEFSDSELCGGPGGDDDDDSMPPMTGDDDDDDMSCQSPLFTNNSVFTTRFGNSSGTICTLNRQGTTGTLPATVTCSNLPVGDDVLGTVTFSGRVLSERSIIIESIDAEDDDFILGTRRIISLSENRETLIINADVQFNAVEENISFMGNCLGSP